MVCVMWTLVVVLQREVRGRGLNADQPQGTQDQRGPFMSSLTRSQVVVSEQLPPPAKRNCTVSLAAEGAHYTGIRAPTVSLRAHYPTPPVSLATEGVHNPGVGTPHPLGAHYPGVRTTCPPGAQYPGAETPSALLATEGAQYPGAEAPSVEEAHLPGMREVDCSIFRAQK